jgi:hypothetical protein
MLSNINEMFRFFSSGCSYVGLGLNAAIVGNGGSAVSGWVTFTVRGASASRDSTVGIESGTTGAWCLNTSVLLVLGEKDKSVPSARQKL